MLDEILHRRVFICRKCPHTATMPLSYHYYQPESKRYTASQGFPNQSI